MRLWVCVCVWITNANVYTEDVLLFGIYAANFAYGCRRIFLGAMTQYAGRVPYTQKNFNEKFIVLSGKMTFFFKCKKFLSSGRYRYGLII